MNNFPAMRADFVGSFLRPEAVKKARLQFTEGSISKEHLTAAEDAAIRALVSKQVELGFKVVTDGGFASCEIGNKLTEEQWAKLRLVQEVAKDIWG